MYQAHWHHARQPTYTIVLICVSLCRASALSLCPESYSLANRWQNFWQISHLPRLYCSHKRRCTRVLASINVVRRFSSCHFNLIRIYSCHRPRACCITVDFFGHIPATLDVHRHGGHTGTLMGTFATTPRRGTKRSSSRVIRCL